MLVSRLHPTAGHATPIPVQPDLEMLHHITLVNSLQVPAVSPPTLNNLCALNVNISGITRNKQPLSLDRHAIFFDVALSSPAAQMEFDIAFPGAITHAGDSTGLYGGLVPATTADGLTFSLAADPFAVGIAGTGADNIVGISLIQVGRDAQGAKSTFMSGLRATSQFRYPAKLQMAVDVFGGVVVPVATSGANGYNPLATFNSSLTRKQCTPECTAEEYYVATANRCAPHPVCDPAVEYESRKANETSPRLCTALRPCITEVQYVVKNATTTSDWECGVLTQCDPDIQYITERATTYTDSKCDTLTVCQQQTQYVATKPTDTSDRVCANLTVCDSTTQFISVRAGEFNNRECAALSPCDGVTTYVVRNATMYSNWECALYTSCLLPGQFTVVEGGPYTDRRCGNVTQCQRDEFQRTAATQTSDAECAALIPCALDDEYIVADATATSQWQCAALTVCDPTTEYTSVNATTHSDRKCQPLTLCDARTQYISPNATDYADRGCKPLIPCDGTSTYIFKNATAYSNWECAAFTQCTLPTNYTAVQGTITSDRSCAPVTDCPPGATTLEVATQTRNTLCLDKIDFDPSLPLTTVGSAGSFLPATLTGVGNMVEVPVMLFAPSSRIVIGVAGQQFSASASLQRKLKAPVSYDFMLVTSKVYRSQRRLIGWFQVQDEGMNQVSLSRSLTMTVSPSPKLALLKSGNVTVPCESDSAGRCKVTATLPIEWFDTTASSDNFVSVGVGWTGQAMQAIADVPTHAQPVFDPNNGNVVAIFPDHTLFPGDAFEVGHGCHQ